MMTKFKVAIVRSTRLQRYRSRSRSRSRDRFRKRNIFLSLFLCVLYQIMLLNLNTIDRNTTINNTGQKQDYKKEYEEKVKDCQVTSSQQIILCEWIGCYSELESHINECPFDIVQCDKNGCLELMLRSEFERHLQICPFLTCSHCHKIVHIKGYLHHISEDCTEYMIDCEYGCPIRFKRKDKMQHMKEFCSVHLGIVAGINKDLLSKVTNLSNKLNILTERVSKLELAKEKEMDVCSDTEEVTTVESKSMN